MKIKAKIHKVEYFFAHKYAYGLKKYDELIKKLFKDLFYMVVLKLTEIEH